MVNVAQRVSFLVDFRALSLLSPSQQPPALFFRVSAMLDMYPIDPTSQVPPYEPNFYPYQPPSFFNPQFLGVIDFSNMRRPFPTYNTSTSVFPFAVALSNLANSNPSTSTAIRSASNNTGTNTTNTNTNTLASSLPLSSLFPRVNISTPIDTNIVAARPFSVEAPPKPTHTLYLEIEFYPNDQGVNVAHFNDVSFETMTMENSSAPVLFSYISQPPSPLASPWPLPTVPATPPTNRTLGKINGNAQGLYELPFNAVIDVLINNTGACLCVCLCLSVSLCASQRSACVSVFVFADTGEHPIHLHSHFFWLIATSAYPEAEQLWGSTNPMRRDTVSVPAQGWAKIRFQANIPGVWPFHCHIDWFARSLCICLLAGVAMCARV